MLLKSLDITHILGRNPVTHTFLMWASTVIMTALMTPRSRMGISQPGIPNKFVIQENKEALLSN